MASKNFKYIIISFLWNTAMYSYTFAQVKIDNYSESYRVVWVKSISADNVNGKNFFSKLTNLILGDRKYYSLSDPINIMLAKTDELIILDQLNGKIWGYHFSKEKIFDLTKNDSRFNSLVGVSSIPNDAILFTDSSLKNIYKLSKKGKVSVFNSQIDSLTQPTGIAFSEVDSTVWVVETAAHRISVFGLDGKLKKRFGKRGAGEEDFNYPTFIWIGKSGLVYIVDAMNFRIKILNSDGNLVSNFGKIGDATGFFARPKGVATDSMGNIYVVDGLFNTVQIFDPSGNFLYNFGSQGKRNGFFWMPTGIYIDDNNNIYVADTYNARIQIFKLEKNINE